MFNPFFDYEPKPILREAFEGWDDGYGLFSVFSEMEVELPWSDDDTVDPITLDISYFGNHSGGKFCSPLVNHFIGDDNVVSEDDRVKIAKVILTKYLRNWNRLWEVNTASYNPIHNYDMTENRVLHGANSEARVADSTSTDEGTETLTHGKITESTAYKFGINTDSDSPKPSDKDHYEDSGDDVNTRDLSSGTSSTRNIVGANEENEELHRSGNIGVTTTQKMIEDERRLWLWNFFDAVFRDMDNELALSVHDPCRV